MKMLGTVRNVIHDGTIILRTSETPAPGTKAYDSRGEEVGRVVRTFGPVSEPYVSLKPGRNVDALALVGTSLYMGTEEPRVQDRGHSAGRGGPRRHVTRRPASSSRPVKNRGVNRKWQRKENPRKR